MKSYSAQSGYAYQYFYQGHRAPAAADEDGAEFVFSVSAGRKHWIAVPVVLTGGVLAAWERAHGRELSSTERYAIAKMALFGAFDERSKPETMREPVLVRAADIDGIIESLGL